MKLESIAFTWPISPLKLSLRLPQISQKTWQKICRNILSAKLKSLDQGRLKIIDNGETMYFGKPSAKKIQAEIRVHHPAFYSQTLMGGSLGFSESYLKGQWSSPDIVCLFRYFIQNLETLNDIEKGFGQAKAPLQKLIHWTRRNTKSGSQKNISAHYDLGNEFFKLFLDESLSYSCAFFDHPQQSLKQASLNKIRKTCEKLKLTSQDHLLEVGTGWGALAIYAVQNYGCQVTTTTISEKQYQYATEQVRKLKLQDKIKILKKDYRDLNGSFDKIVSIEMIEALGYEYFGTFFEKCDKLLKAGGKMLLQSILMREDQYERSKNEVDFIKRYIFPGGCIPSLGALNRAMSKHSSFQLIHFEDITAHYVKTLQHWRKNFLKNQREIRKLGFPEEFLRCWEYYFTYCEAGFAERYCLDAQMVMVKPND